MALGHAIASVSAFHFNEFDSIFVRFVINLSEFYAFLGGKFALMAIKILTFNLMLNFSIQTYEKTQIPLKFANTVVLYKSENGIHLEFKPRS